MQNYNEREKIIAGL